MATLITVFLGSPQDVKYAREIAKNVFNDLNNELIGSNIYFRCFDYHDLPSQIASPQPLVNEAIRKTGLVILFFGKKAGIGTMEEYRHSFELYRNDKLFDLMVYFEKNSNSKSIKEFKVSIRENILFQEFTQENLTSQLLNHLRLWSARKSRLFEILYSFNADNNLLTTMRIEDPIYGDQLIDLSNSSEEDTQTQGNLFLQEYMNMSNPFIYQNEGRCYLIARVLYQKILNNDHELFKQRQFINLIHQHLSKLIRHSNKRLEIITILLNWLSDRDRMYNNVRNFAAFELGMCKSEEAIPVLLQTIKNYKELIEVRYYATMALGMIGNKRITNDLLDHYPVENNPKMQILLRNVFHHLYK